MKTLPSRLTTDELLNRHAIELNTAAAAPTHPLSIKTTLAAHQSDPTHRFHATGGTHDDRATVAAGGALQRMRGRRH